MQEIEQCIASLKMNQQWFSPKLQNSLMFQEADTVEEKLLLLTPAERKILSLIAKEKSSKEIAELLFISEKTVENHRSNILKKIKISSGNNALTIWAMKVAKVI